MKILNLILIFCAFIFLAKPVIAAPSIGVDQGGLAQKIGNAAGFSTNVNQYTLSETIGRLIRIVLTFIGTIFFALTVYAGFLWMTAQGNDEKIAKATGILRTAVIGMIVVVAAYSITAMVMLIISVSAG